MHACTADAAAQFIVRHDVNRILMLADRVPLLWRLCLTDVKMQPSEDHSNVDNPPVCCCGAFSFLLLSHVPSLFSYNLSGR